MVCEQVWSGRQLLYRKCTKFYGETLFGSVQGGPLVWEEPNKQPDPQHRCLPHITTSSSLIIHFTVFQNNLYQTPGHLPLHLKKKEKKLRHKLGNTYLCCMMNSQVTWLLECPVVSLVVGYESFGVSCCLNLHCSTLQPSGCKQQWS